MFNQRLNRLTRQSNCNFLFDAMYVFSILAILFDGITAVDIADLSRISVVYQDRIRVVLGNDTNMEYKLRLAAVALTDPDQGLLPADRGTLDVSMTESDGSIKAYFDPGTTP